MGLYTVEVNHGEAGLIVRAGDVARDLVDHVGGRIGEESTVDLRQQVERRAGRVRAARGIVRATRDCAKARRVDHAIRDDFAANQHVGGRGIPVRFKARGVAFFKTTHPGPFLLRNTILLYNDIVITQPCF